MPLAGRFSNTIHAPGRPGATPRLALVEFCGALDPAQIAARAFLRRLPAQGRRGQCKGPSAALPQPDAVLRQHPAERDRGPALAMKAFRGGIGNHRPEGMGQGRVCPSAAGAQRPFQPLLVLAQAGVCRLGGQHRAREMVQKGQAISRFSDLYRAGLTSAALFYPKIDRKGRKDPPDPAPLRPGRRSMAGGANRPLCRMPRRLRMRKIAGRSLAGAAKRPVNRP